MMQIELTILKRLLRGDRSLKSVYPYSHLLSDEGARVTLQKFIKFKTEFPNADAKTFIQEVKDNKLIIATIKRSLESESHDELWENSKIEDHVKSRLFEDLLEKSISRMDKGLTTVTQDSLQAIQNCANFTIFKELPVDYIDANHIRVNVAGVKVPTYLKTLNKHMGGGPEIGSLNVIMCPPNVGKTLVMANLAKGYAMSGLNVLYVSLEISEYAMVRNMDANILDLDIGIVESMNVDERIDRLQYSHENIAGKFWIKRFPTRGLTPDGLMDYALMIQDQSGEKIDVVFCDYLNIMDSGLSNGTPDHSKIREITEGLRGVAGKLDNVIWTATQPNRESMKSGTFNLASVSGSIAISETADFLAVGTRNEQLDRQGKMLFEIEKSRYGDKDSFMLGCNPARYQIYDAVSSDYNKPRNPPSALNNDDIDF